MKSAIPFAFSQRAISAFRPVRARKVSSWMSQATTSTSLRAACTSSRDPRVVSLSRPTGVRCTVGP
ncbi:hypothetical protein VR44_25050 [Streptomyces katrae]|uniref:Uncharacterized protein n=1 Tax=Streptomyces katrae TaxID=68223 RepID=A0A0F4J6K9_9ACTN|nr:hypothetical protein VR44_25050 [Streptomyces katrae]